MSEEKLNQEQDNKSFISDETKEDLKKWEGEYVDEETVKSFMSDLTEKEEPVKQEKSEPKQARKSTEKSSVGKDKVNKREGMVFGGKAYRNSKKADDQKKQPETNNSRRGVHKIWEDKPFNAVGEGVSRVDIQSRKAKR